MKVVDRAARSGLTWVWSAKFGLHVGLLFLGFVLAYELRRPLPARTDSGGGFIEFGPYPTRKPR